jgi:hypothetical protein
MNTATKQDQKNQRQKTRQKQRPKKQGRNASLLHDDRKHQEHEHPEMRLTR